MKTPRKVPARASAARKPAAPKKSRKKATSTESDVLSVAEAALADMKAVDIRVLDVRGASDVTDYMVIASGTSDRHLRAVADRVVQMSKAAGFRPLGVEGEEQGEWVLVDLPDVMVHVMLPRTREFYQLEQLWEPLKAPTTARPAARPAARKAPRSATAKRPRAKSVRK